MYFIVLILCVYLKENVIRSELDQFIHFHVVLNVSLRNYMIGDELLRYFMISKATTRRWRERNRQADRQPDSRKARHTDSQSA